MVADFFKAIADSVAEGLSKAMVDLLREAFEAGRDYHSWSQSDLSEQSREPDFDEWVSKRFK